MGLKKFERERKRARKMAGYHAASLNGPRAVARRRRQRVARLSRDPIAFVREFVGVSLAPWQERVLAALSRESA